MIQRFKNKIIDIQMSDIWYKPIVQLKDVFARQSDADGQIAFYLSTSL